MSQIVIDASVAFAWVLSTQRTASAMALQKLANAKFVAPFVFHYELRNGLRKAENEKRISQADADLALQDLATVIEVLEPPDVGLLDTTMDLARRLRLSLYDAGYVELTQRLGLTLASRDGPMIQAATKVGVAIYDAR